MDELELRPGGPPQAAPPTIAQLKTELRYERRRARDRRFAAAVLAVLAALAVLAVAGRVRVGCRCCASTAGRWNPRWPKAIWW